MRHILLFGALALLGGCYGESVTPEDYPQEEPISGDVDLEVDPGTYEIPVTSELGTEKVRPLAKTIAWPAIGTEEGETYLGGAAVIEKIFRQDADNNYGVRVRLRSTAGASQNLEYLIRFHTRTGAHFAGYEGSLGDTERWKRFSLEPYQTATVQDFSRVIGAEGFILFVRPASSGGEGLSDEKAKAEKKGAEEPPEE